MSGGPSGAPVAIRVPWLRRRRGRLACLCIYREQPERSCALRIMPVRNAAGQSAFQNIVAKIIRSGLGMDSWLERDCPFIGKKKPRIAKNCKESKTGLDNTKSMPDQTEKRNGVGEYLKTQFSLAGKTALLTGGAGGIGRALAFAPCSAGADSGGCGS